MARLFNMPSFPNIPHLNVRSRQQARRIVFGLVLLVVLVVPPVFVNHPIGYLPLVMYLFLLLICWGYLRIIKRGFTAEHHFRESSCMRGSTVELPIILKNRSKLPIFRARPKVNVINPYGEVDHEAYALSMIGAMDDDSMNTKVRLGHVGIYTAGLQGIDLYDPLMFFCAHIEMDEQIKLAALPQSHGAGSLELSDLALHSSAVPTRTVLSDDVDYAGTRDYEFGDPLKSVHWKLSARTEQLQTRLFEESVSTKLAVIMDFHSPDYEAEDLMTCSDCIVEMALALMRLAESRKMEARLRFIDKNGLLASGSLPHEGEMEQLVSSLPRLSVQTSEQDVLGLVQREMASAAGADNIVVCTSSLTKELIGYMLELSAKHVAAAVVLAVPRSIVRSFYQDNRGLITELELAGVTCIVLSDPSNLEEAEHFD